MARDIQPSFTAGELAPSLHGRNDLQRFQYGLKTVLNWYPHVHGGLSFREGMEFTCEVKDSSTAHRVIPFKFNTEQAYSLIFGHQYMWVIKDGGLVLNASKVITGITNAATAVVTIAGHGYTNGHWVYISDVSGMSEINGRFYEIANVTANTFQLVGVDSTGYGAYTSGGNCSDVYEVATPYSSTDLRRLKFVQSNDVMTITHPTYEPRELSRTGHAAWAYSIISFGTTMTAPTGVSSVKSGFTAATETYSYKVTAVSEDDGTESLASSATTESVDTVWPSGAKITISWSTVSGAGSYNIYKQSRGAGPHAWIGTTDTLDFVDDNIAPDYTITPYTADNDPFPGVDDYPSCPAYHQQRLVFGNTNNNINKTWMSQSGAFSNFNKSSPLKDDDGIEFSMVSKGQNDVRHIISLDDMIIFTNSGEWRCLGNADGVITPTQVNPRTQGEIGCSHVRPLIINKTALFVQELGSQVYDFNYSFDSGQNGGYKGNEISILSNHLFDGYEIVEWDFSKVPNSIAWTIRDDGKLLGLTYNREHEVWGWHQHSTPNGTFESVASIPEGKINATYFVVVRTINGQTKRYIERLNTQPKKITDSRDAFYLDSGLSFDFGETAVTGITQANPAEVTAAGHNLADGDAVTLRDIGGMTEVIGDEYTVANTTANTFELVGVDSTAFAAFTSGGVVRRMVTTLTGLHHLEGETIAVVGDGSVQGEKTVSGGSITMDTSANKGVVGYQYNGDLEFLPLDMPIKGGTVQGEEKAVTDIVFRVEKTRGLKIGPDFDRLNEYKQRQFEDYGEPIDLMTGDIEAGMEPDWTKQGNIVIRQDTPMPAHILAAIPTVEL